MSQLVAPGNEMRMCAFLWSYYGYPTSTYEGINVEAMHYRNGAAIAERDIAQGRSMEIDYVGGVPDSGTPHAIGYANRTGKPFARAFIKYTPTWARSFTPARQADRRKIAKMKQIPVHELIVGKNLLFVDDSIVRGTQLQETVDFLYENGAKSVHMRSACPPIMYGCKFLNFSRATSDMELISRRTIVDLEGMTAEENEIAEAYTVICRQNNMTMEELKQYVDAEFEQAVIQRVLTTKAMALIRETAVITTAN
jgi:amidophosphoribosyltransferase